MNALRPHTALLLAALPATAATVAVAAALVLKAGAWELDISRHEIRLTPRPRKGCPDCRGAGGWWSDGPYPDGETCWCWDRPTRTLHLLPRPDWADEPPF
ncbi:MULTISPECIES: hypothetical protein [unclassified Streptomyces]|uniref:hypothetical protein n=1 Tax=unclassified Streptomyces TaxID=2593676 RepID=UPI0035DAE1BF